MRDESKPLSSIPKPKIQPKDDAQFCSALSRGILRMLGIWLMEQKSGIFGKVINILRVVVCYFLLLFLIIPFSLHILLSEKDQHRRIKSIGPVVYYLTALAKYTFLVGKRNAINECLNYVSGDSRHNDSPADHKIMINSAKLSRYIGVVCTVFTYSSSIFFRVIIPICAKRRIGPNNQTLRPLGTPVYRPFFSADDSPNYEIVYTLQIMSSVVISSVTIASAILAAAFVLHACGQLRIVMSRLGNYVDGSDGPGTDVADARKALENRMAEIIDLHLGVIKFVERTEDLLNEVCLIEFLVSMVQLCLTLYYVITEFSQAENIAVIGQCVIVITFTFNIFILCYIGEQLGEQVQKVGYEAYLIDWYKLPEKNAKGLILLLAMTKYPCRITAGKMAELSYASFSGVLKTSVGYFNLLREVAQ